jgi:hypothetical protein
MGGVLPCFTAYDFAGEASLRTERHCCHCILLKQLSGNTFSHLHFIYIFIFIYASAIFLFKMDPQTQMDISNLSEADKKDLSQILQNESQKTTIQQCELQHRIEKSPGGEMIRQEANGI